MKKLLLNLQLFAGDESDNTPTDEVENKPAEDAEKEDTPEFDDTSEENANENDSQKEEKEEKKTDVDKKKTNKENAERRIAEKQKKEQEKKAKEERDKIERDAYLKGLKRALGDKNPYTDKPIVDEEDLEEYEIMKKLEEQGKDPIEDFADYIKQQKREAKNKALEDKKAEEEQLKYVQDNIAEVDKKYGEGTAAKYLQNERFKKMFSSALENKAPLLQTIENYMEIEKYIEKEAEDKAIEKDARRKSSPGGIGKDTPPKTKSIEKMSSAEFNDFLEKEYGTRIH